MSNYQKVHLLEEKRTELHNLLGLTGCEISVNNLPEGAAVPFVHAHIENEEIYIILEGQGEFFLDGKIENLKAHDVLRVDPKCVRAIRATKGVLKFICIQCRQNSLNKFTATDAILPKEPLPDWLKK